MVISVSMNVELKIKFKPVGTNLDLVEFLPINKLTTRGQYVYHAL